MQDNVPKSKKTEHITPNTEMLKKTTIHTTQSNMEQIELFMVESPCRSVCKNSKKGFCVGCLRSREERFLWHKMEEQDKRKTIQRCKTRWQKLIKAKEDKLTTNLISTTLPYGMTDEDIQPPLLYLELPGL